MMGTVPMCQSYPESIVLYGIKWQGHRQSLGHLVVPSGSAVSRFSSIQRTFSLTSIWKAERGKVIKSIPV